jgi:hypothetical protein
MKKVLFLVVVAMALIFAATVPSQAEWGHRGWHHGGWHHGGWHYRGWVGPRVYWGDPWAFWPWYPWYPSYPYYPYSSPYPPPTAEEQAPAYAAPEQEGSDYWYYCKQPAGYYPYVRRCPGGWMKVVPDLSPHQ